MVIIVTGPTGSGKTELMKELEKLGYCTIYQITTRKARKFDYGKVSITDISFETIKRNGGFVASSEYNTVNGIQKYGIPKFNIVSDQPYSPRFNLVIEGSYLHNPDLIKYCKKEGYKYITVHLDVDDDTIIKDLIGQDNRKGTEEEILSRLNRDKDDMEELKNNADCVINNSGRKYSPKEIAKMIFTTIAISRGDN